MSHPFKKQKATSHDMNWPNHLFPSSSDGQISASKGLKHSITSSIEKIKKPFIQSNKLLLTALSFILITIFMMGNSPTTNQTNTGFIVKVDQHLLTVDPKSGLVYDDTSLFTGTGIRYYKNGQVAEEIVYLNGQKSGQSLKYSQDGKFRSRLNYLENKLLGKEVPSLSNNR